jgi:hypothetical protein
MSTHAWDSRISSAFGEEDALIRTPVGMGLVGDQESALGSERCTPQLVPSLFVPIAAPAKAYAGSSLNNSSEAQNRFGRIW